MRQASAILAVLFFMEAGAAHYANAKESTLKENQASLEAFENLKKEQKQSRRIFLEQQKKQKQVIREQAQTLPENEKGHFLQESRQKLEAQKNAFLRQQALERKNFSSTHPQLQSKSAKDAARMEARKQSLETRTSSEETNKEILNSSAPSKN